MPELLNPRFSVLQWYPTALIGCKCQTEATAILIITGVGNVVLCGVCNHGYVIEGMTPDGKLSVKRIPHPSELVM